MLGQGLGHGVHGNEGMQTGQLPWPRRPALGSFSAVLNLCVTVDACTASPQCGVGRSDLRRCTWSSSVSVCGVAAPE